MANEKIRLSLKDFEHLVAGGELATPQGNHIILADFGYESMGEAMQAAGERRSAVQENNVRMMVPKR